MASISSNGTGGGLSNATASWAGGVVPVEGDKVTILNGDTIEMNDTHIWGNDSTTAILIYGILKASRTASSSLTCKGDLWGESKGALDYGKVGDAIPIAYTHDIILNYSATMVDGKYGFRTRNTADFLIDMHGAEKKVNALTTSEITSGSASVDVDDVTGWEVGDKVVLATTGGYSQRSQYDIMEIQGIAGNTVTFTANVTYTHAIGCRIGNFSSNVTFKPYDTDYQCYIWLEHDSGIAADSRRMDYVAFDQIGGSSTSVGYAGLFIDSSNSTVDAWSGGINNCSIIRVNTAGANQPILTIFDNARSVPFSDCAFFSGHSIGFNIAIQAYLGVELKMTDCVLYYSSSGGVTSAYSEGGVSCVFDGCTFIGLESYAFQGTLNAWKITDSTILASHSICGHTHGSLTTFTDCIFGTDAQKNAYQLRGSSIQSTGQTLFTDCVFAEPEISFVLDIMDYVTSDVFECKISNKNLDPSQQEIYKGQGAIYRDNSIYNSGSASLRFEPVSATVPLSFDLQIFAPSGLPVVVSGYLRKNSTYGSSTLPKVTLLGLGITEDSFEMTDVDDEWVQFKVQGTQSSGTDGMLTLRVYAQSSGTDAKTWIDTVVAPPPEAVNSGEFGYWANALPVSAVIANYTSAIDVWNVQKEQLTLDGSIGKFVKKLLTVAKFLGLK